MPFSYKQHCKTESLRETRRTLRLTQKLLSEIIGCTVMTIRNYEQGKTLPSGAYIDLLHRLCRERNIEPPDFYNTNYRTILKK